MELLHTGTGGGSENRLLLGLLCSGGLPPAMFRDGFWFLVLVTESPPSRMCEYGSSEEGLYVAPRLLARDHAQGTAGFSQTPCKPPSQQMGLGWVCLSQDPKKHQQECSPRPRIQQTVGITQKEWGPLWPDRYTHSTHAQRHTNTHKSRHADCSHTA